MEEEVPIDVYIVDSSINYLSEEDILYEEYLKEMIDYPLNNYKWDINII